MFEIIASHDHVDGYIAGHPVAQSHFHNIKAIGSEALRTFLQ